MSLEQYLSDQGNSMNIGSVLLSAAWRVMGMNEHALCSADPETGPMGRNQPYKRGSRVEEMPIYDNGTFHFLCADEVYLVEADGNYCRVHTPLKSSTC